MWFGFRIPEFWRIGKMVWDGTDGMMEGLSAVFDTHYRLVHGVPNSAFTATHSEVHMVGLFGRRQKVRRAIMQLSHSVHSEVHTSEV